MKLRQIIRQMFLGHASIGLVKLVERTYTEIDVIGNLWCSLQAVTSGKKEQRNKKDSQKSQVRVVFLGLTFFRVGYVFIVLIIVYVYVFAKKQKEVAFQVFITLEN